MCGVGEGGGVIFLYLVSYMFQSILNIFVFFEFFLWGKMNYFHGWGVPHPPPLRKKFRENNQFNF